MEKIQSIDEEWMKFISNSKTEEEDEEEEEENDSNFENEDFASVDVLNDLNNDCPKSTDIYISTKTKIAYLNQPIDLKHLFWSIQVTEYAKPINCVIKKQMKFNSTTGEELDIINENLKKEKHCEVYVMTSINNPTGRIKFKDIRKISVGISKKDIMSYRSKKKSAFYNCFVLILRIKIGDLFREFHVKVFNTGKMEIPGVQKDETYATICQSMVNILQPYVQTKLGLLEINEDAETVLVNSNFNAGFYINRETFFDTLQMKYNIQCIYDPCSYPGIQCKIYYNETCGIMKTKEKDIVSTEISFMIFRTGSILIVGKCNDSILSKVYEFLKIVLNNEYIKIGQKILPNEREQNILNKCKKKKIRKKDILIEIVT